MKTTKAGQMYSQTHDLKVFSSEVNVNTNPESAQHLAMFSGFGAIINTAESQIVLCRCSLRERQGLHLLNQTISLNN